MREMYPGGGVATRILQRAAPHGLERNETASWRGTLRVTREAKSSHYELPREVPLQTTTFTSRPIINGEK